MMSISGKTTIDWSEFAERLAPVEVISEPVLVKKRSRDCFWYSPVLNEELKKSFGDLVAVPKTNAELSKCLSLAHENNVPIVVRGGGTGNYGQSVPIDGGLIIQTTELNKILEIGDGFVRVQAGALMSEINAQLKTTGWEMAMFPSTQKLATIGGFVAGGSVGIGSLMNGALRDPGNIHELRVLSVEGRPVEHSFTGDDIMRVHHAWGLNGVITEVTLRTVPALDWVGCLASFPSYADAYNAGAELATNAALHPKMASVVDARIAAYFPQLKDHMPKGATLLAAYVPKKSVPALHDLFGRYNGTLNLALDEEERSARSIPHVFEFSFNHTTLQVLKFDRSATYQQIGVPNMHDTDAILALRDDLGDAAWTHHEFCKFADEVAAIDLPIVWRTTMEGISDINRIYEKHGFIVYEAHNAKVERGGLHNTDYRHLAWKKRLDPKGLLNSAKSDAWENVKHMSAEDIEEMIPNAEY